jgi:hypothetical protein
MQPKNLKGEKSPRKIGKIGKQNHKTALPTASERVAVCVTLRYHRVKQIPFHHPARK